MGFRDGFARVALDVPMPHLLLILAPIALLDSLSMVPLCLVPLAGLLGGPHGTGRSFALIAGVFAVYLASGALVLLGLQAVFEALGAWVDRVWREPEAEELGLQILLGVGLCALGTRMLFRSRSAREPTAFTAMTATQAFVAGALLTVAGLPGAVPYFAAIDLILRAEITATGQWIALTVYNLVFVAPLVLLVAVARLAGPRGAALLEAIRDFLGRWGPRLLGAALVFLGIALMVDGVGWILGRPLFPV